MENKEESIGALWEKVSKNGDTYLSGNIKINDIETKIILFYNKYSQSDTKQPKYRILKAKEYVKNDNAEYITIEQSEPLPF